MRRFLTKRTMIGISIFAVGVALLLLGIFRGEVAVVLNKAIYVCLECIGIG